MGDLRLQTSTLEIKVLISNGVTPGNKTMITVATRELGAAMSEMCRHKFPFDEDSQSHSVTSGPLLCSSVVFHEAKMDGHLS
jgi:hypothetical protein